MPKRSILVIDDDPRMRELITDILTSAGFEVHSAPDGISGIELARTAQPAAIVLDMMMPGIDGIDTLERLKRDLVLADIPVVGMTASADLTYTGKAFRAGADFFVPKPFGRTSFITVVEVAVDKARRRTPMRHHRHHPRFPAALDVRCLVGTHGSGSREVVGTAGNASLGGLLLFLPEIVAPGIAFGLWFGVAERTVRAEAKVIWQNRQTMVDGRLRHGIQFLRFGNDSGLVGYRRYLSQIAAAQAL